MRKLLLIQSHVVHGYVGNKAATFPLQLRGWDIDALNTVQYSNHPAYGSFAGRKYDGVEIRDIYDKISAVAEVSYSVLLTGYVNDAATLEAVVGIADDAKRRNPQLKWFLDPILGDGGRMYVDSALLPLYKQILQTKHVFLVTPNHFEMELLTDVKIHDPQTLAEAFQRFHQLYPQVENVVVTSVELPGSMDQSYICAASSFSSLGSFVYFEIPKINAIFFGSGDLFSALLADTYVKTESLQLSAQPLEILKETLSEVLTVLEKVLRYSYDWEVKQLKSCGDIVPKKVKVNDLKIIQSKLFFLSNEKLYSPKAYKGS